MLTNATEKLQRDMDTLTPLDARNSLLLDRTKTNETSITISYANAAADIKKQPSRRDSSPERYVGVAIEPSDAYSPLNAPYSRPLTPSMPMGLNQSRESLRSNAAPLGQQQPTLPNLGGGYGDYSYGQQNGYSGYRAPGGY